MRVTVAERAPRRFFSVLSTSALLVAFLTAGCGNKSDHPGRVGDCPADANCLGIGGPPGGGGGTDAGTTLDATDVGEVGPVDIHAGEVRSVASFTQDPATGVLLTEPSLVVKGAQGAKFIEAPVTGGTFVLPALDNTSPFNFVYLQSRATTPAVTRTVFGFHTEPAGGPFDVQIPSFPDTLAQALALALGVPTTSGSTRGTATVVLQLVDGKGVPLKNVFGEATPDTPHPPGTANNPFYDDNSDGLTASTTGTGTRGTIVWLAVPPGVFTINVRFGSAVADIKTFGIVGNLADTVTFLRVAVVL
jgi:hypothetical protein